VRAGQEVDGAGRLSRGSTAMGEFGPGDRLGAALSKPRCENS
jgi:hypothetical protein